MALVVVTAVVILLYGYKDVSRHYHYLISLVMLLFWIIVMV